MVFKKTFFFIRKNKAVSIIIIILICALSYYLYIHRKPFTQNAFVVANVHPVTSFISGYVTHIYVKNNTPIKKGEKILTVYKRPYELQVLVLQKKLEAAKYFIESLKYDTKAALNEIKVIEAKLENAIYLAKQAAELYKTRAVSQQHAEERQQAQDSFTASLEKAKSRYISDEAEIARETAEVESLKAQIEKAQVELALTTVYAQSDGMVTNMYLTTGSFVAAGSPLFAFINNKTWWIQANFKETELSEIRKGQKAKIWMWQYPGKIYYGIVENTDWGVERRFTSDTTGVSIVNKENEWFLLPQRFPVQIKILNPDPKYPLHLGASAFVEIQTNAYPVRQFFWQLFQI